jgi:hypothetical protein
MVPQQHDEAMTAALILVAVVVVVLASVPFGVDSRRTSPRGHYRPNWRS